jgi:FkbM family methyltransferase
MFRILSYATIFVAVITVLSNTSAIYRKIVQPNRPSAEIIRGCGSRHTVRMEYKSPEKTYSFYVSVHDPAEDTVISKRILESGPNYPSVDEIHAICEHSADCSKDKIFVEVGSAVGMVSLYAASRGMRVFAFDVLSENVRRLNSSVCINSRLKLMSGDQISVHHNFVGSDDAERTVESEPGNLAATMRGGGVYRETVKTLKIDDVIGNNTIELMLLTCQGFEYEVSSYRGVLSFISNHNFPRLCWALWTSSPQDAFAISCGGGTTSSQSTTTRQRL